MDNSLLLLLAIGVATTQFQGDGTIIQEDQQIIFSYTVHRSQLQG